MDSYFPVALTLALVLVIGCVTKRSTQISGMDKDRLSKLWIEIDSLQNKQLDRSALDLIPEAKHLANVQGDQEMHLKAILTEIKLTQRLGDTGNLGMTQELADALKTAESGAEKAILQSMLAESLAAKAQDQQANTRHVETGDPDPHFMSYDDLMRKSDSLYTASLGHNLIESLGEFGALIAPKHYDATIFGRLQDVLYLRAIRSEEVRLEDGWLSPNILAYDYTLTRVKTPENKVMSIWLSWRKSLQFDDDLGKVALELRRLKLIRGHFGGSPIQLHESYLAALETLKKDRDQRCTNMVELHRAEYLLTLAREAYPDARVEAHRLCLEVLDRQPDSLALASAQAMISTIERSTLAFESEEVLLPGEHFLTKLAFQNVSSVLIRIVKLPSNESPAGHHEDAEKRWKKYSNRMSHMEAQFELPTTTDYHAHTTDWIGPKLKMGRYAILISAQKSDLRVLQEVSVSALAYINSAIKGKTRFAVLDRKSGRTLSGVDYTLYEVRYNANGRKLVKWMSGHSDSGGLIDPPPQSGRNLVLRLQSGEDVLWSDHVYWSNAEPTAQKRTTSARFFTDRSIYKLGDRVLFKCILFETSPDRAAVPVSGKETVIKLLDVNGQEIAQLKKHTNGFGAITGHFELPKDALLGHMQLSTVHGNHPVRVEEFKKPSFSASLLLGQEFARLGDTIQVDGEVLSFAGFAIGSAAVRYTVHQRSAWWMSSVSRGWVGGPREQGDLIAAGLTSTDRDGNFTISFGTKGESGRSRAPGIQQFEVRVEVTDLNGETQETTKSFAIGTEPYYLRTSIGETILSTDLTDGFSLTAHNSQDKAMSLDQALVRFFRLPGSGWKKTPYWNDVEMKSYTSDEYRRLLPKYASKASGSDGELIEELIVRADFESIPFPSKMPAGRYRIEIKAEANSVAATSTFTSEVVAYRDEYVPSKNLFFLTQSQGKAVLGDTITFWIASTEPVEIKYLIEGSNTPTENSWQGPGWHSIDVVVEDQHLVGLHTHFYTIYENRWSSDRREVAVSDLKRQLQVEITGLPNRTEPGKNERMDIQLRDHENQPIEGAYTLVVYDRALDELVPHRWDAVFSQRHYFGWTSISAPTFHRQFGQQLGRHYSSFGWSLAGADPDLNWFGIRLRSYRDRMMMRARSLTNEAVPSSKVENQESALQADSYDAVTIAQEDGDIRHDFRETMLWIEDGRIDKSGKAFVEIPIADDLTTWKAMILIHDEHLGSVLEEVEIQSRKDLMLIPNAPRFLYQEDKVILSCKVVNNSDQILPIVTDMEAMGLRKEQELTLASGQVSVAEWTLAISNIPLGPLTYKIRARSGQASDAIADEILVVPRQKLISETKPLVIESGARVTYALEKIAKDFPRLAHEQLIVDLCVDPRLYAIQALPSLQSEHPSITEYADELYGLLIAGYLERASPGLLGKIAQSEIGDIGLERNSELLLREIGKTPWKPQAVNELLRRQHWATLISRQLREGRIEQLVKELTDGQLGNGAFSWMPGGRPSRYITAHVIERLAEIETTAVGSLDRLNLKKVVHSGLQYLEREMSRDLKRQRPPDIITAESARYLYVRSQLPMFPLSSDGKKVSEVYTALALKSWYGRPTYVQALLALALRESMRTQVKEWMGSLRERAIHTLDRGIYWKNQAGQDWEEQSIEQHALLMRLFRKDSDTEERFIEDLERYLIMHRQANVWPGRVGTVMAIQALLARDSVSQGGPVTLNIGGETHQIDTDQDPFFRLAFAASVIDSRLSEMSIENGSSGLLLGFVQHQYFTDIDQVEQTHAGLSVSKSLFKVEILDGAEVYVPIDQGLAVGDRILTRFTIEADRPMQFIHLADNRASVLQPVEQLSGRRYTNRLGFYQASDAMTSRFFIDRLSKGKHVLEYESWVTHRGQVASGPAEIQSAFFPGYHAQSEGATLTVN